MAHAHITARFCPRDMRPPAVPSPKEGRNGHSRALPKLLRRSRFLRPQFAEEFAAWNPEPDSYKEELHRKHQARRPERVRS